MLIKSKSFIYILSAVLLLSSIICLSGCEDEPVEEPTTEHKVTYEEFVDIIVPAYVKEDFGTIYANSFANYDLILNDRLDKAGDDKTEYYKSLSEQYGCTINNYTDLKVAEFKETELMLKNQFGEDYQVSFTVSKDTHFTTEEIANIGTLLVVTFQSKGYEFSRYFNPTKITDAHEITFSYTIKGSKFETSGEDTILILEYNGEWVYGELDL